MIALRAAILTAILLVGSGPASVHADPAPDPVAMADALVADEHTVRDRSAGEPALAAAAHRQQVAYRDIVKNPGWDAAIAPHIPPELADTYRHNIDAGRALWGMTAPRESMPPWTIQPPAPAGELLGHYHDAQAATGVDWNYLAAVNLVESRFGRINGDSPDGAQGPMQFMPATFAAYGTGDVHAPRDAIFAAAKYLAANGFAADRDGALHRYNHSAAYVRAVNDYAAVLAADPAAFAGYYRWDVYYKTSAGDILLPVGYSSSSPMPAADYVAAHPQ